MEEKKIPDNELMTETQLDNITGGATGYIYYMRDVNHGVVGYSALKVTGKLSSREEVFDTYSRTRPASIHDLRDGRDEKFFVPDSQVQMLINNMSARGYDFIDVNRMRR